MVSTALTRFFLNILLHVHLVGDKSEVIDVDNPDLMQYPLFINAKRYRARMVPGDVLYIPGTSASHTRV